MSTVTEKQFLTEEELTSLKKIQANTRMLIAELGEIELIKLQLENRHDAAKKFLSELRINEQELTKSISEKYGKANVDPETGEITPVE
jgi:hypothetical protein